MIVAFRIITGCVGRAVALFSRFCACCKQNFQCGFKGVGIALAKFFVLYLPSLQGKKPGKHIHSDAVKKVHLKDKYSWEKVTKMTALGWSLL